VIGGLALNSRSQCVFIY